MTATQRLATAHPDIRVAQRWGIYCRISKDRTGAGLGVERQEAECRALVPEGDIVVDVYVDNDISAASNKPRPEYQRLLADLRSGRINGVIAWHNDRLHRKPMELEEFIGICEERGADVKTVTAGQYDLTTPAGRFTARIIGATARVEWENARERRKSQLHQQAQKGGHHGGGRYYGRDTDMSIREHEAEIVREAARRHLDGASLNSLADELNERREPTARGGRWTASNLGRMLRNPHMVGIRVHKGTLYPGDWLPILDEETYNHLIALLEEPGRKSVGGTPKHEFTGLLKCGRCGHNLATQQTSKGKRGWKCDPKKGGCGQLSRIAHPMEQWLLEEFFAFVERPGFITGVSMLDKDEHKALLAELEKAQSDKLDAEVARYAPGGGMRSLSHEAYVKIMAQYDVHIGDINRRLRAATPQAVIDLRQLVEEGSLREAWPNILLADRRAALRWAISHIEVLPLGLRVRKYVPETCYRITWAA